MATLNIPKIQPGSEPADGRYRIEIDLRGPYMVYGTPPMAQQFIVPDNEGQSWEFHQGASYDTEPEPVALCRCGGSRSKPYCDGMHHNIEWDPTLSEDNMALLDGIDIYEGPQLTLTDNPRYCVFARFCDAKGRVWNIVEESDRQPQRDNTIREANMCPGGRLSAWDKSTGKPFEPHYDPSIGLIEDPAIRASGGLWVRGGIPVVSQDGHVYEIRNRVVLCRCGASTNKPFCDGRHASMHFDDQLPKEVLEHA